MKYSTVFRPAPSVILSQNWSPGKLSGF